VLEELREGSAKPDFALIVRRSQNAGPRSRWEARGEFAEETDEAVRAQNVNLVGAALRRRRPGTRGHGRWGDRLGGVGKFGGIRS
jgi:hypothetical protein